MPVFAQNVLETDSVGLGLLLVVFCIGAFAGSLGLALIPNLRNVGKLMIGAVMVWHASILVFAVSDSLYLSMAVLAVTGMAFGATQVFMLALLLGNTKSEFQGRVMGLRVLAIYAFTLSSIAAGAMARFWGAPWPPQSSVRWAWFWWCSWHRSRPSYVKRGTDHEPLHLTKGYYGQIVWAVSPGRGCP